MVIFTFAIIAIITWSLLLIPYVLWLRRSTFFFLQRGYLLGSLVIGLLNGVINILPQGKLNFGLVEMIKGDNFISDNLNFIISGITIGHGYCP